MELNKYHTNQNRRSVAESANLAAASELKLAKDEIIGIWEARVRTLVKNAEEQTSLVLRNSLPRFLDELISALSRNLWPNKESIQFGMAAIHGGQRATFVGYHLPQLLKEFSILRQLLNETLHKKGVMTYEVRTVIDQAIDSVISSAATEFAKVQHADTKAALLKSEASNLDLERFAAVAAHDLKSPLSTIAGYLSLLDEEFAEKLGDEGVQFVRLMIGATQRMRDLIDSLLDYVRLTGTKKPFQRVSLYDVVKAAMQNLNRDITITKAIVTYSNLPYVIGDPDLLIQVFQNLIANSIKFRGREPPLISLQSGLRGDS